MFLPLLLRNSTNFTQTNQIHAQIIVNGLRQLYTHLFTKLIHLSSLDYALSLLTQLPLITDHSYNSLIKAYTLNDSPQTSLSLYSQMLRNNVKPSNFTYPFLFKACSSLSGVKQGEMVHTHVVKLGFECDLFVSNSLIDMYCKCLCVESAHWVFNEMLERDEVSWNTIIAGYVCCGDMVMARELFDGMPIRRNVVCWTTLINGYGREGNVGEMFGLFLQMLVSEDNVGPNAATMVCLLSACSALSHVELGRWMSVFVDVNVIPLNIILSTALIDMYLKCGEVEKARRLFDGISYRNLVTWNVMITGYVQRGLLEEAIKLFYLMQESHSTKPDEITMVNVLSACAGLGALEIGRKVHIYLGKNGLDLNMILATALVDMYSKCGSIEDACIVFVKSTNKDAALCNALISGLANHGKGRGSLAVLSLMEKDGIIPNDITYNGILSACNHSGLIEEGRVQFSNMVTKYGLSPKVEHYSCMVNLLGRAGYLDEAFELVQNMVVPPDSIIWGALLNACRIHHNVDVTDKLSKAILSFQDVNIGLCILLSNLYASVGRWADVARIRRMVKERGIGKPSGCSWVEVDGAVHRFLVEDTTHVESQKIYDTNRSVANELKLEGYVSNYDFALENIDVLLVLGSVFALMDPKAWKIIALVALDANIVMLVMFLGVCFGLSTSFFFIHAFDIAGIFFIVTWLFLHFFGDGLRSILQQIVHEVREVDGIEAFALHVETQYDSNLGDSMDQADQLVEQTIETVNEYSNLREFARFPKEFCYKDLKKATKHFKRQLGSCGSGSVFKGKLDNGTWVTVKRIDRVKHGE
ncbi:hypothetical protein GIB67_041456 [Kingdonia uniflora]|uniref:Chlororespiratory reduction 21 n=1 Tax=Kingdonia uniflora TaxID=39325 RepID=A0A7J7LRI4_9MAGN|nr:hypothetical protein GIB67_041456 [Kingdonia uniflora]